MIIISSVWTACAKKNSASTNTNMRVASMTGNWELTHIGEALITYKASNKKPSITIDTNVKTVTGYSGCNRMSGSIASLAGTSLKFGPMAATKRMCAEPNNEREFLRAFEHVASYGTKGGQLYFLDDKGVRLLTFDKIKSEK